MIYKKLFLILPVALVLVLSGCHSSSSPAGNGSSSAVKSGNKKADTGITALAAWQEVQKEVKKWHPDAKLVSIKDKSYASFQRQDGLADVWEFTVDECLAISKTFNYCNKGKSRSYLYSTTKGGWGPQGVSARAEQPSSYLPPINTTKLKIDTDKAVDLARQKMDQKKNSDEEFIISTYITENGTTYWEIVRQCFYVKGECSESDGYDVYVNTETGEVLLTKPQADNHVGA